MTNEKMLELVNKYMEDRNTDILFDIKTKLEEDIRKEVCKSKGNASKDSIIRKMFKPKTIRGGFKNTSFKYGDKRAFTDNFRMYVLNDDYGYVKDEEKDTPENLSVTRVMPRTESYNKKVKVDINDLKSFIKINKADIKQRNLTYIIEQDDLKIAFNPNYLLEALQIMDTDTIYCSGSTSPALTSLNVSEADNEEFALVLPVKLAN